MRFVATEKFKFSNGAIGWRPGGPYYCLGPFARVTNCKIEGTDLRLTAYATDYSDRFFRVPAYTRYLGQRITGYFTLYDVGCIFIPDAKHIPHLKEKRK